MRLLAITIAISWIAFWLYWIVSAFGSKKDARPGQVKQFFGIRLGIIVMAAILAALFNKLPPAFKNHFPATSGTTLALGLIVFLLGLTLAVWARVYLGRNWGMPMTRKQNPELVTTGPYRYVRHPIYTGILLMAFGSAVDVNVYWLLVLIVAAIFFIYSAVAEEKLMMRQFPKAYPAYKSKTKMLVPLIF